MKLKSLALALLVFATVTACAHPMDQAMHNRDAVHEQTFEVSASISHGACDDVGQFIPGRLAGNGYEASAAPTHDH